MCSAHHRTSKDSSALLPDPAHLPMPDLSSQPLDPNEPTYCLCNQVSFGEMIGCDNEEVGPACSLVCCSSSSQAFSVC